MDTTFYTREQLRELSDENLLDYFDNMSELIDALDEDVLVVCMSGSEDCNPFVAYLFSRHCDAASEVCERDLLF